MNPAPSDDRAAPLAASQPGLAPAPAVPVDPSQAVRPDLVQRNIRGWHRRVIERFSRITTSGNYLPEVDGLRFIAISVVILHHVALMTTTVTARSEGAWELGQYGVELFFAISGFVLAVPFAQHRLRGGPRVRLKHYFLRRLTRLEPPYLLILLAMAALKILAYNANPLEPLPYVAAGSAYLHGPLYGGVSPILGAAWSLEVEVQFYLLMPLLAFVFAIGQPWLRRGVIAIALIAAVAAQPIVLPSLLAQPWDRQILNYVQFFFVGLLLADLYVSSRGAGATRGGWIGDVVWLIGWPMLAWVLMRAPSFATRLAFPALVLALYASLARSTIARRFVSMPVIATIGGMCYSIYLVHNAVIHTVSLYIRSRLVAAPQQLQLVIALVACVPAVLVVSSVYFLLIERPCMRRDWPRRLLDLVFPPETPNDPARGTPAPAEAAGREIVR